MISFVLETNSHIGLKILSFNYYSKDVIVNQKRNGYSLFDELYHHDMHENGCYPRL